MQIKINKKVSTPGEAQEVLRGVIGAINNGEKKGKGWTIGDGEIEKEAPTQIPHLDELAGELGDLIINEEISDEMLREASEGLLPALWDVLCSNGYGMVKAKKAQGDVQVTQKDETPGSTGNAPRNANTDSTGGDTGTEPWNQKK